MSTTLWTVAIICAGAILVAACENTSGLSESPRATFSQVACLDVNGDHRINEADAADPSKLPDFNADRSRDDHDAAFLKGIDIELDPAQQIDCSKEKKNPEFLVAHGYIQPSDVSCGADDKPVLLLGIGGGVENIRDKGDASGVRSIVDALQKAYDDRDRDTIGVISGQAVIGGANAHSAMEQWLTNVVKTYFDRYPCISAVIVGHSHGGILADDVASHIEAQYPGRILAEVKVDRVGEDVYLGDTTSRPVTTPVFNIYQTNVPGLSGHAEDAPNVENWDASGIMVDGKPVTHTQLDNNKEARERIVAEVMERS